MPSTQTISSQSYLDQLPEVRRAIYEALIESVSGTAPRVELQQPNDPYGNSIAHESALHKRGDDHQTREYPYLFAQAEAKGLIVPGITPVVETFADGAAITFSHCANVLGFNTPEVPQVIVPAHASKRDLLKLVDLGVKIHFVPPGQGEDSDVHYLEQLLAKDKQEDGGKFVENPHQLFCFRKFLIGTEYS